MAPEILLHLFGSHVSSSYELMFFRWQCPFSLNGNSFFWRQ